MSTEKLRVVLDIEAEVGKIEGALKALRGDMSNLQLPKGIGKDFENRMSKLSDEIKNFHNLASKMGNSLEGAGKIDASYKKILEYTRKVENSLTAIKEEAGIDATKFFPKEIVDRIEKAEQAMKDYEAAIEKGRDAYKQEINDLKAVEKQLDNLRKKQISLEGTKTSKKTTLSETKERQKQVVQQANLTKQTSSQEQVAIQKRIALLKEEKEAIKVVQKAQEEANKTKVALKSVKGYDKGNLTQQKSYDSKKRNDDEARANLQRAQEAAKTYGDTLRSIPDIEAEIAAQNQALKQQETIYNQADAAIKKVNAEVDKASTAYNKANQELQDNANQINQYVQEQERLNNAIKSGEAAAKNGAMNALANALKEINIIIDPTTQSLEEVKTILNNLKPEAIQQLSQALKNAGISVDELELGLSDLGNKNRVFQEGAQHVREMNSQMDSLKGHIQQFFSLTNSVMLFRRGVQKAFESVKELDAAMTETAVVTDFSVGDMWDQLPRYTAAANELGTTTLGAYETMTLFYQQGLETNEVFEIGTETMKMARIAGLDYADATDLMTAALRGFNMELNEASATRINDVYSELAAITAADTSEIATAMTKTASIASNANMEFETTAALLSQIIETTREPAETAGTAMKTIIARFTEMKKATSDVINVDGEEVSVNKVEAALKSAGVALRDVNGEFRDLDDVFLELSSKWNGLDKMTQRYVATMAAGSRQQSRFIAMMQDYDRTMELVDAAYNSNGASQKQFEKTQDSLESKINRLKNAWNEFLMGIANSDVIKTGVDALTGLLNIINKITGKSGLLKLGVAIGALRGGSRIFNKLFSSVLPFSNLFNKKGTNGSGGFLQFFQKAAGYMKSQFTKVTQVAIAGEKMETAAGTSGEVVEAEAAVAGETTEATAAMGNKYLNQSGYAPGSVRTSRSFIQGFKNLGNSATTALTPLISALGTLAPLLTALGVEVSVLAAAWYFSEEQTLKRDLEDATKAAESANDVFEQVNGQLDNMTSSRDGLVQMQEELDGLTKGTNAWREQLIKVNTEILRLADEYGLQYTIGSNGQLTIAEDEWDRVIKQQTSAAAYASTTNSIAQTRVDQLNSELEMIQELEKTEDEISYWDEAAGIGVSSVTATGLGTIGALAGAGIGLGSGIAGAVSAGFMGMASGAVAGSVVPIAGTIIGALVGIIAGAAAGYGVNEAVEEAQNNDPEYQKKKRELEAKQQIEREARLQQYSAALYSQFSTDETIGENKNLDAATELIAEQFEKNLQTQSTEMGLDDWRSDGANKEEIEEWAKNLNYTYKDGKIYDQGGKLVYKVEKSGDAHEGEEGWITNEQIAQQLAVQRATNTTKDSTKVLLGYMTAAEQTLGLEEGSFSDLLFEEDLNGSQIRQLMKTDIGDISSELNEMSLITGQDMNLLMQQKKQQAQLYYEQMNQEMAAHSALFSNAEDFSEYQKEFNTWQEKLTDEQYGNMLDQYKLIKETMGAAAGGFYIDALKENTKDLNKFQNVFNNIDFSNPINAYADLKKVSEETNGEIKETVDGLLELGENQQKTDKGSQWRYFFNSEEFNEVRKSLDEIKQTGQQITAENIYELAESSELLRTMLNSGAAGAQSLLVAIEGLDKGLINTTDLTENFVEALSELNALADMTAKAFNTIDNLNLSRSATEISTFWSDSKDEILELYDKGAYGDQRLIDYMVAMLGSEQWNKALAEATNKGGGYKEAMADYINRLKSDSESMYSDWRRASQELDFVGLNKTGDIVFDFQKMTAQYKTTEELVTGISEKLGLSKSYVEAMIVDLSTFSSDFRMAYEDFSGNSGLKTLLEGAGHYQVNGNTFLNVSREQLAYFVEDVDEFIEKWNSLGDIQIDSDIEFLTDTGELGEDLKKIIDKDITLLAKADLDDSEAKKTLFKLQGTNLIFKSDLEFYQVTNEMYQHLLNVGLLEDQARSALEKAFTDEYQVYIAGDKLTEEVLGHTLDGVQNNAITLASIEQAEIVAQVYYKAVYAAMVAAIRGTLGALPGYEQYVFLDGSGKKYTTNTHVDDWTSSTKPINPFTGNVMDLSSPDVKQKNGVYYIPTTYAGNVADYVYNSKTGAVQIRYLKPGGMSGYAYASSVDENGSTIIDTKKVTSQQKYKTVIATDANGKQTTITFVDNGKLDVDDNKQSPYNSLSDEPPTWTSDVSDDYKTGVLKALYGDEWELTNLDEQWQDFLETEEGKKWYSTLIYTDPDGRTPSDSRDEKDKDSNDAVNYEKESDKIKSKIDEIDSAIEDLADNDIVDMQLVNQLIDQKIALQREYKRALEQELGLLSASTSEIWSQVKQAGNDKYIEYSDETGGYQYTDAYYDDFFKNGLPIDSEQMQKVQEQMNELNQANSDQLSNQVAIRELVDQLVENQAENYNAERALKGRERRQTEADAEEELIGMLPEEIQPFFQALNTAEDARLEMQEIQANKILAENLQQQLDASYASVPDYIKENMTFDEYSGYGIDLAKINQIEDKEAREEMLTAVQENAKILNEQYFDPLYDVKEQLSGGKLQKGILTTAKALKDFAKEVSDNDFNDGLLKVETGFKALDEALNGLIERIENSELVDEFLNKKAIGGLGLGDKERDALLSNEKLVEFLGKSGLGPIVSEIGWGEGATNGELLSLANGFMGGALEQIGGFLNFDMMKILGDGGGLIEQGKQMVEQIVGKIAEITGALIDAWTNREDILYNFLNVLERYLHDYEVMQRYSTQLEKGRMASVDDIRQNWEQQWQSLQDQLEMQQERIETRQDQLDRSRWNPFQLISGWDPTSDSLYENRGVKMAFDLLISAIGMLPMGLGAFGSQLNQLYEDYDKRVQEAYEDRLAAEMAILDIEDERLELVKIGAEEATEFEQKVLDALVQKEQEQIEELSRLNDAITNANSKLISTLQKNLDQIRQDRENEKKEEELGEKERRLAYLRQDTSGANMMEIKKLEEELEEGHEDYTDTLIDQKISELEKQNEAAAEQRQQQIDLLQAQLDWSQKYGLYWDAIYGMLYTIDENGNAVLNPENFDLDGNIRENSQLAQMLGTFSDRLGMSVWSSVLDNEEAKRLGRYYGAFIGNNGVSGEWADYWALLNPGADDPDYATPMPEIPDGIWGVLYRIETSIGKYFGSSNMGLWNAGERLEVGLKNILGDVFNIEEWANATAKGFHREDVIGKNTLTLMNGWNKLSEGLLGIADFGNKTSQSLTNRAGYNRHQNNGDNNISNYFNIGTVGENISLDDMVDKVSSALREVFSAGTNIVHHGR